MKLAEKIVKLREQHGLSQKELARGLGVTTGVVAEWEAEDAIPSVAELVELSKFFSVSIDSLAKEDETVENKELTAKTDKKRVKKSVFKRVWFWIAVGLAITAATATTLFLFNREVKPLLDENGEPLFVNFTDEVYRNAKSYLGYHVDLKGQVFQNLGTSGGTKGIQVWMDPETCEQNVIIYHTANEQFKDGDYVIGTGYIKDVQEYTNTFGVESSAPLVYAADLKAATYIDVMSPATDTIIPTGLKYEQNGYSVSVDKVEFAEKETRLYLTATNNGKAELYIDTGSSFVVQNGKQYNTQGNYEAEYEEIPYVVQRGASCSGIVTFPAIENTEFEYKIELHSDDFDEQFDEFSFKIAREESSVVVSTRVPLETIGVNNATYEKYGYSLAVELIEVYEDEILIYLIATNNGSSTMYVDVDDSLIIQNAKQYSAQSDLYADYQLPYKIATGVEAAGVVSFPAIEVAPFDYIIEIHSDNFDEDFDTITYKLTLDPSAISQEKPEEHAEKASTTNTAQTNTNYRNEQALSRATAIVQGHSDATRQWITDCLEVENYSEEEIQYALEYLSVDWSQCAVAYFMEHVPAGGPGRAEYYLPAQGFTPNEIQFVIENVDWYAMVLQVAMAECDFFNGSQNARNGFINTLISHDGFTEEQAIYGVDNCGINWEEPSDW